METQNIKPQTTNLKKLFLLAGGIALLTFLVFAETRTFDFINVDDTQYITRNGRVLIEKGRAAEVEWCAQRSRYNVVGFMDSSVIRPLPQ